MVEWPTCFSWDVPCEAGRRYAPILSFEVESAELVAELLNMRGAYDEAGVARPTEEDIGAALMRATGDRECADETLVLDSAVPALKELLDAIVNAAGVELVTLAMNVASTALSALKK